jgi:pimeloyl-ACP methyl ester carboxylesterase
MSASTDPLGTLKQIEVGDLRVGYADVGPSEGHPVVLLHGWPYDINSYAEVAPVLASAGYRVIVPYLRGYGTTSFLSDATVRNGQQSVLAVDVVALMDALGIERGIVGGFDWGARTANVMAALWPNRCKAMVSVSGYLIGNQEANKAPLPPPAELSWWYQFYFATERGRLGYERYRDEPSWKVLASPPMNGRRPGTSRGGTKQKLNLALALLGDPKVLLLDEPYQGFDRGTYVNFWDHVHRWREEGKAVVIATHMLAELDRVDRVVELAVHPSQREEHLRGWW